MSPKNSHGSLIVPFANNSVDIHQNNQMANSRQNPVNNHSTTNAGIQGRHTNVTRCRIDEASEGNNIDDEEQNTHFEEEHTFGSGSHRRIRPEDVLWWICLFFTFRCFDLPAVLIFHRKINRIFLQIAFFCSILLALFTFLFALIKPLAGNRIRNCLPAIQLMALFCFLAIPICFCLATWDVFGIWSIFMSIVSVQSTMAFIAVL